MIEWEKGGGEEVFKIWTLNFRAIIHRPRDVAIKVAGGGSGKLMAGGGLPLGMVS